MRRTLLLFVLAAALGGCDTAPVQPDPTQVRINDIDARLARVEGVVNNQSLVNMSQRLDTAEAQLRDLRGSVEELQNSSAGLSKQQRDLYADLDRRVAGIETQLRGGAAPAAGAGFGAGAGAGAGAGDANAAGAPPGGTDAGAGNAAAPGTAGAGGAPVAGTGAAGTAAPAAGAAPAAAAPAAGGGSAVAAAPAGANAGANAGAAPGGNPMTDQAAYAQAFDLLKVGNYAAAVTQFSAFLQAYPDSTLLANAQYWLGQSYFILRDYDDAAKAFRAVGERWPDSRKAPDALLSLGLTQSAQQHEDAARATLGDVVRRFPDSDAAKLATQQLQKPPAGAPNP